MEKRQYTRWEKFTNWFYYNKWWLLVGGIVLYVVLTMVWNALGIGQVQPDHCIAYVGSRSLPQNCVTALEQALSPYGEDVNGDGRVTVRITQHITTNSADAQNQLYGYAAEVTVLADISQGESYFFLVEDPEQFQQYYQILAHLDGSIPAEEDFSAADKVLKWADCPVLAGLELGQYTDAYLDQTENGDCQALLKDLYLGRRYYYDPEMAASQGENDRMWDRLTQDTAQ